MALAFFPAKKPKPKESQGPVLVILPLSVLEIQTTLSGPCSSVLLPCWLTGSESADKNESTAAEEYVCVCVNSAFGFH